MTQNSLRSDASKFLDLFVVIKMGWVTQVTRIVTAHEVVSANSIVKVRISRLSEEAMQLRVLILPSLS